MYVHGNGQLSFSNGSISVVPTTFYIYDAPCTAKYIILMNYNTHGFVEVRGGIYIQAV